MSATILTWTKAEAGFYVSSSFGDENEMSHRSRYFVARRVGRKWEVVNGGEGAGDVAGTADTLTEVRAAAQRIVDAETSPTVPGHGYSGGIDVPAGVRPMSTVKPGESALWTLDHRAADARVTLAQLGMWTRARLGVRDLVKDDAKGWLSMRVGPGRPYRKLNIQLQADDTYALEIGVLRKHQGLPTYMAGELVTGVYADALSEVAEAMFARAVGA